MTRPADAPPAQPELLRFSRSARWVHGLVGVLMLICLGTAAVLYTSSLAVLVGHRPLVELVHVWCGFALPVPLLLGLVSPSYRAELRRLDRFTRHDWRWLRSRTRRNGSIPVGKFNAGQKLNGAFVAGSILVMLSTGTIMLAGSPPIPRFGPDWMRTGATFVHDWLTLAIFVMFLGHLYYALNDRGALLGLATGRVSRSWAAQHHAGWLDELDERTDA
jgi:formate dehydrogenase subunit gamma